MSERPLVPPPLVWRTGSMTGDDVARRAAGFLHAIDAGRARQAPLVAMPMANDADSVALFFALTAGDRPIVVLPQDPRAWLTDPPIPAGTCIVLPPAMATLAGHAEALGLEPCVLSHADAEARRAIPTFFRAPRLVLQTSGSTGLPKPVCRRLSTLADAGRLLARTLPLPADGGALAAVPLDRAFGLNTSLTLATVTQRPLGLLDRFDHNDLFALCESHRWASWSGTPAMVDVLSRSRRPVPAGMPRLCTVGGRLSATLATAYRLRFGNPPRAQYGTTETFTIALDLVDDDRVRHGTVGQVMPGLETHFGEAGPPHASLEEGRLWVRTPLLMEGYGYPPDVRSDMITADGWWMTPDVARIDAGDLVIVGRADDRIRTAAGHVIDPKPITDALEAQAGVREAIVLPVEGAAGMAFAALVEADASILALDLRAALTRLLPAASVPRLVRVTDRLPRLASGRVDRRACLDLLTRDSASVPST